MFWIILNIKRIYLSWLLDPRSTLLYPRFTIAFPSRDSRHQFSFTVHGLYLPHPPRLIPVTDITSTWDDQRKPVCSILTTSSRNSIPSGTQTVTPCSLIFTKPSSTGGLPLSTSAALRAAQPPPSLVTIM